MQTAIAILVLIVVLGGLAALIAIPLIVTFVQARRDRRRIIADGVTTQGTVDGISTDPRTGSSTVRFRFVPVDGTKPLMCEQQATAAAVEAAGLHEGSVVQVRYIPKWPSYAFVDELVFSERIIAATSSAGADPNPEKSAPAVFFISYSDPANPRASVSPNSFRWVGHGDITIAENAVAFSASEHRLFRFPGSADCEFPIAEIVNVEAFGNVVRLEVLQAGAAKKHVTFWTVDAQQATNIADRLPKTRTEAFSPQMAEQAEFAARIRVLAPGTPVTLALVALNSAVFIIAAFLGAGVLAPNSEVLIRLGSDYTPLTASGQWWRLLTSIFLHFGLFHVGLNMWALYTQGQLAERIYGSVRFLFIYIVAGLAGSVASYLWHPIVNGAGASGAIFGVLGALLAFFIRSRGDVPLSVVKTQRNSALAFIIYSLLNGARVQGIDNAAHLGGLVAGMTVGFLLTRRLTSEQNRRESASRWIPAGALVVSLSMAIGWSLHSGVLHPRAARDRAGHEIPRSALLPPTTTLAGVRLGMSPSELASTRGEPIKRASAVDWLYNAADPTADGVVEVYFGGSQAGAADYVSAVIYVGGQPAAPPELPYLGGSTRPLLVEKYGEPVREEPPSGDRYLFFRNGVVAMMESGAVLGYGIYRQH